MNIFTPIVAVYFMQQLIMLILIGQFLITAYPIDADDLAHNAD
jgi:hypothetical protein